MFSPPREQTDGLPPRKSYAAARSRLTPRRHFAISGRLAPQKHLSVARRQSLTLIHERRAKLFQLRLNCNEERIHDARSHCLPQGERPILIQISEVCKIPCSIYGAERRSLRFERGSPIGKVAHPPFTARRHPRRRDPHGRRRRRRRRVRAGRRVGAGRQGLPKRGEISIDSEGEGAMQQLRVLHRARLLQAGRGEHKPLGMVLAL